MKKLITVAKQVLVLVEERKILEFGGSLAFFWFLALFPGLVFFLSLSAYFDFTEAILYEQINTLVPGSIGLIFLESLLNAIQRPNEGLLSVGAFVALWSASQGFSILITLTVQAYGEREMRSFFVRRGLAVLFTLLFAFSALLIIASNVLWGRLTTQLAETLALSDWSQSFLSVSGYMLLTFILSLIISIFYKVAPEQPIKWSYVIPGSLFTVVAWQLVSFLFSLYVNTINNFSIYGSLGGITISLVWLYLTGIILLIGTDINRVWSAYRTNAP